MELSDRQQEILGQLRRDDRVEVEDLAQRFGVTTQTIRRDLAELCDRGLAARTHGGARRIASVSNLEYRDRRAERAAEKEAIGRLAATLIPNDCSVTLNIGTTTEQVSRALTGHQGLVVLTNNINITTTFMGSKLKELILVGGSVRQSDGAIVGEEAVEFISRYKVDYAVIGASGLDPDGSVLDFDAREVSVARAILRNSRHRILVCDSAKFDVTAPVRICDIGDIDTLVTDRDPPAAFAEVARQADTRILTLAQAGAHA